MADFSVGDAALTGFGVVWRKPVALLVWWPLLFLMLLGVQLLAGGISEATLARLKAAATQPTPNLVELQALLTLVGPTIGGVLAIVLVQQAIWVTAVNRAVMKPDDSRFGYLRLSLGEVRQLILAIVVGLIEGAAAFIALTATGMLADVAAAVAGPPAAALAFTVATPAVFVGLIYLAVRLSLASPLTFATGKIDIGAAWRLTEGRFWSILGALALALVLSFVVFALMQAIEGALVALVALATGGDKAPTVGGLFTPALLVDAAVAAVAQALIIPISPAAAARIYRALTGLRITA